ncbi:BRO family protein [Ottowia sp.]|uniref:BRO family protein n=1 Tax=Ottowia sp. TaxID=1898956 RepID=UPI002CF49CA2|nr:BRO family protein [Ottowia sp.]HOB66631.1 BRO family protein [Ottowia sp.]HPZ56475.1 BRO family protein [Ottowia sp.]HQD47627.1 BRO family protein [Ottowia sp.]
MSSIINIAAAPLTMTSREIAELTGKQHAHVMRDIRAMMEALEQNPDLDSVCRTTTYAGSNGQAYDQYELDKDTCLTLLLGYDAVARMKVVKRWQELEAKAARPAIPPTYAEALRLAADLKWAVPGIPGTREIELEKLPIRVVAIDGEVWFVGKDVAEVLGYKDATNAMKQHCRGVAKHHPILDSLGRTQEARILSEPDVLRLIVSSKLPAAARFESWVFDEVLPTLLESAAEKETT